MTLSLIQMRPAMGPLLRWAVTPTPGSCLQRGAARPEDAEPAWERASGALLSSERTERHSYQWLCLQFGPWTCP